MNCVGRLDSVGCCDVGYRLTKCSDYCCVGSAVLRTVPAAVLECLLCVSVARPAGRWGAWLKPVEESVDRKSAAADREAQRGELRWQLGIFGGYPVTVRQCPVQPERAQLLAPRFPVPGIHVVDLRACPAEPAFVVFRCSEVAT